MDWLSVAEIVKTIAAIAGILGVPAVYLTYRYLNFFELLASLRKLGQISDEEITGLFDYDLRMIAGHQFIVDALQPQGFERLSELTRTVRFLPRR